METMPDAVGVRGSPVLDINVETVAVVGTVGGKGNGVGQHLLRFLSQQSRRSKPLPKPEPKLLPQHPPPKPGKPGEAGSRER